jgi:hypothetical protein
MTRGRATGERPRAAAREAHNAPAGSAGTARAGLSVLVLPCAKGGKLYHGTRINKIWDDEDVARFLAWQCCWRSKDASGGGGS